MTQVLSSFLTHRFSREEPVTVVSLNRTNGTEFATEGPADVSVQHWRPVTTRVTVGD